MNDLGSRYDRFHAWPAWNRLFGDSGFRNLGLWPEGTRSPEEAAGHLLERLVGGLPVPDRILDVACGPGATTAWLAGRHPGADLVGVDLSEGGLARARERVPAARFLPMDAGALDFPDGSFDLVVCVEAACHFPSRARFLAEARRVLRPGGHLAVADLLFHAYPGKMAPVFPDRTCYPEPGPYLDLYRRAGFAPVDHEDVLGLTVAPFCRHAGNWALGERLRGRLNEDGLRRLLGMVAKIRALPAASYPLVRAAAP